MPSPVVKIERMAQPKGIFENDEAHKGGISRGEKIAIGIFFVLLIAYAVIQYLGKKPEGVELGDDIKIVTEDIVVQVEGAVMSPGLVSVPEGAKVLDAIQQAGGFREDAYREAIDLSRIVTDRERIVVLSVNDQRSPGWDENNNVIRRMDINDGVADDRVNINTAGIDELVKLPGIGETIAQRIIDHRDIIGMYRSIEQLMEVQGIGEAKFNDIRELVTTGDN
jgi:competence protein ComEA